MKLISHSLSYAGISLLAVLFAVSSCSKSDDYSDMHEPGYEYEGLASADGSSENGSPGNGTDDTNHGNTQAGIVTAGEWKDLTHWDFWSKLMLGETFSSMSGYWEFFTNNRVAVKVVDEQGSPLPGVKVKLLSGDRGANTIWETVTDNHGQADCWIGLFQLTTKFAADQLRVSLNDEMMDGHPVVCAWDSLLQSVPVNNYVLTTSKSVSAQADIAFVVDATGSMADEINFLKQDLVDIINKVKSVRSGMNMRTAALFYRDEGDEYLTRLNNFTNDVDKTANFVEKQFAEGGGDYPEAVHTALERMLQDLSWDEKARTRIAFLILDAPAHYEDAVIRSLHHSIENCARQGIIIIPVAASGVDKNTEFMLRFFANATGGTYVFLTDDSGVGFSHLAASVGEYKVELLNNLLIRLIEQYTE